MEAYTLCQKLCQVETRRVVMMMGIIICAVLAIQFLTVPNGIALSTLFPAATVPILVKRNPATDGSSSEHEQVSEKDNWIGFLNSHDSSEIPESVKKTYTADKGAVDPDDDIEEDSEWEIDFDLDNDRDIDHDIRLDEDDDPVRENEKIFNQDTDVKPGSVKNPHPDDGLTHNSTSSNDEEVSEEKTSSLEDKFSLDATRKSNTAVAINVTDGQVVSHQNALQPIVHDVHQIDPKHNGLKQSNPPTSVVPNSPPLDKQKADLISERQIMGKMQSDPGFKNDNSTTSSTTPTKKKKKKEPLPPMPITEMNRLLLKSHVSFRSMKPRWSSPRDQEILAIKAQIENAPILRNDPILYASVFRNVSQFRRSYELMEHMLKVYVYKEGGKPVFHTPILKGLYASEGWFMRLMEGSKQFRVKDPQKAHLFYMPFSSRFLEIALYVPGSHSQRNLVEHLRNYLANIAAMYPFWNRTAGTDHFLVACHDWAPSETRPHMGRSIRALCNADLNEGFKIGKDVSLPETFVRLQQNPLRDLGGKPANKRPTLAFFAGNMHGALRTILLQHWENKDPDMKIFGPMPNGSKRKSTYIQHMKTSKYCLCPRGYEVNSPRVVEAIYYECVPVIISDNFVPPFFNVLNWEEFAVFVAEKDIPRLKEILLAIPEKKYITMQLRVKQVQKHFLWHSKPMKYDIFHMILHSIWFNRVYTIRPR